MISAIQAFWSNMLDFLTLQTTSAHPTAVGVVYSVLLSFVLSSLVALTYEKTFRGLSYSRNFIQSLILGSVAATMVMQAIGDNLARGLGMMGALGMIRFRTVLKDPRDIIFIFAAMGIGISCGVYAYTISSMGAVVFCVVAFFLYYTPFGEMRYYDGILRFSMDIRAGDRIQIEAVFKSYCKKSALITLREMAQGNRLDYAYHIKLKDGTKKTEMIEKLKAIPSIEGISLMLQETTVEL